eukprot:13440182-Heterocapsa_arctica.AAC.1
MSMNQKAELHTIEEKLASIENIIAAGKEMTHIGLKEIEHNIDAEHYYNSEKFSDIMECVNKMSKRKKDEMEEERANT